MVKYNVGKCLSEEDQAKIDEAAIIIETHFLWSSTSQGHDYWDKVHRALIEIANQELGCPTCGHVE